MLKAYKINSNEFNITTNIIYFFKSHAFCILSLTPSHQTSSINATQPCIRILKTRGMLHNIKCRASMKKMHVQMHVQIPLYKTERELLYTDAGKMV